MIQSDENPPQSRFAELALPLPLRQTFTYRLPMGFSEHVKLGSRLLVPFGKRNLIGYVVAIHSELDPAIEIEEAAIRDALELLDEQPLLTDEILKLAQWTADYYAASWGEVLKASLPAGINSATEQIIAITDAGRNALIANGNQKPVRWQVLRHLADAGEMPQRDLEKEFGETQVKRAVREMAKSGIVTLRHRTVTSKVKPKLRKAVKLIRSYIDSEEKPLSANQQKIIDTLAKSNSELLFTELLGKADVGASAINTLVKRGILEVSVQEVLRDPLRDASLPEPEDLILNQSQDEAFAEIKNALQIEDYKAFLLHGVTGSGKTEVYIRSMKATLDNGKSALMLVPEIALTPIFSRRLRAIFGEEIAILHSNLSPGERFDEWRRIRSGNARIAIGTRSAVFAPLQNLGLIVVDEEHDSSYRQNESPFYNARDVAVMRANLAGAVIVLGSATPALESYQNAKIGKYKYLNLPNRIGDRPLASTELIDMRDVFKQFGKDVTFSPQLIEGIQETHRKGEQSIILLNRRGFSRFVLCRTCGESLRCKNCDITLTFHRHQDKLICHYCGHNVITPEKCPFCESEFLYFIGEGTEQLEDMLKRKFPQLTIARIDRDTMKRRGELAKILLAFDRGEIDMLVGTQMLAKGHDFHNVTLVGVISVDTGLGLPDFRSAEKTFQLLTQVAGRAGRGNLPGRVLIQTYYPEHYALRYAGAQDFDSFFAHEIRFREKLSYPPFVVLASILIRHSDYTDALKNAGIIKRALDNANSEKACRILGVAPASISRLKDEYRLQILIKSGSRRKLREMLDVALDEAEAAGCDLRTISLEIDPVNLM